MREGQHNLDLQQAVWDDPTLSNYQKQMVVNTLDDGDKLPKLLSGATGAAVGASIGKYNQLSPISQILLGAAGFGIGKLIYNVFSKQDRQFAVYSDRVKAYEMDTTRY